jgi:hypothetical protein
MCQRICSIKPADTEQETELVSYMLRLNRAVPSDIVCDRIRNVSNEAIQGLNLIDFQNLFECIKPDDEFIQKVRSGALHVLRSRKPVEILEELLDPHLSKSADIFKAGIAVAESGIQLDSLSAQEASLLLRAWGKQKAIGARFIGEYEKLISNAFLKSESLVLHIRSLSRLPCSTIVMDTIVENLINHKFDFQSSDDIENFLSVVQSLTILTIQCPELISYIVRNIDSVLRSPGAKNSTGLWKLSAWWQHTCNHLPFDSMIPDILRKEFPDTIEILFTCPSEVFIQQVKPRTWYAKTIESVSEAFRSQHIPFTVFPRISGTPLRALFMLHVDRKPCYIVLVKTDGDFIQTSSDSALSKEILIKFAQCSDSLVSFIPLDLILDTQGASLYDLIAKYVVNS